MLLRWQGRALGSDRSWSNHKPGNGGDSQVADRDSPIPDGGNFSVCMNCSEDAMAATGTFRQVTLHAGLRPWLLLFALSAGSLSAAQPETPSPSATLTARPPPLPLAPPHPLPPPTHPPPLSPSTHPPP